jgi:hypothetical protein
MSSDAQAHAQNAWFILGLMRSRVVGKRAKYARVSWFDATSHRYSNSLAYGSAWVHLTVDKRYDFFYVLGR